MNSNHDKNDTRQNLYNWAFRRQVPPPPTPPPINTPPKATTTQKRKRIYLSLQDNTGLALGIQDLRGLSCRRHPVLLHPLHASLQLRHPRPLSTQLFPGFGERCGGGPELCLVGRHLRPGACQLHVRGLMFGSDRVKLSGDSRYLALQ